MFERARTGPAFIDYGAHWVSGPASAVNIRSQRDRRRTRGGPAMAAQPPIPTHDHPEKPKPWYQTPLGVALIGAVVVAVIGLGTAAYNRSKEQPGSDGASIVVDPVGQVTKAVSGSGWKGDTKVTIRYPITRYDYSTTEALVSPDGTFRKQIVTFRLDTENESYTVTVTGNRTGHKESKIWGG
jgi:hypothetical protein